MVDHSIIEQQIDRSGLSRWLKRSAPDNFEAIRNALVNLVTQSENYGFTMRNRTFEGMSTQVNSLNLERGTESATAFIDIIFDKREIFRFQTNFGLRSSNEPYQWKRSGTLSKDRTGSMNSRWWGAGWLPFLKEKAFRRDWNIMENNLSSIIAFLETGAKSGHVFERSIGSG